MVLLVSFSPIMAFIIIIFKIKYLKDCLLPVCSWPSVKITPQDVLSLSLLFANGAGDCEKQDLFSGHTPTMKCPPPKVQQALYQMSF